MKWGGNAIRTYGFNSADTTGTTVTSGATQNTKGSWTEVCSATPFDVERFVVSMTGSVQNRVIAFDVGVGASSSEVVLAPDLWFSGAPKNGQIGQCIEVPMAVPEGARMSVRTRMDTVTSQDMDFVLYLVGACPGGGYTGGAGVAEKLGHNFDASNTYGTAYDCGTTANTKAGWTELGTSAVDAKALQIFAETIDGAYSADLQFAMDIGVGASSSEVELISNWMLGGDAIPDTSYPTVSPLFPVNIPSGTRFAVNGQCSVNTSGDRAFNVNLMLYG